MTPAKVIREMRDTAETSRESRYIALACDIESWIATIEEAMREPVAYCFTDVNGMPVELTGLLSRVKSGITKREQDQRIYTPLFTFPPDAAAEIARLHSDLETAERALDAQTDFRKEIERLLERIATAYGYLWHANDEPGTPNRYGSERAAIEARKVLRELLTGEQRGKGINAARAAIVGADMNEEK